MRRLKHISPTGLALWNQGTLESRKEFFLKYLADEKVPSYPQTLPMAIGSTFDCLIKNHITVELLGKDDIFDEMFVESVEEQHRDQALVDGRIVFAAYKTSGALSDLIIMLETATEDPRMEVRVNGYARLNGAKIHVTLQGVPDLYFKTRYGMRVIHDWKVNGYNSKASPKKLYIKVRDGWDSSMAKSSRNSHIPHRDAMPVWKNKILLETSSCLSAIDKLWATQLAFYAWILGEEVGADFVASVDQICGTGNKGLLRVANYRNMVFPQTQYEILENIQDVWTRCNVTGHVFDMLTEEENDKLRDELDEISKSMTADPTFLSALGRKAE